MSFKSWCEEHYPVSARDIASSYQNGEVPMTDVIQHSIDKWKGLRKINIQKHEVVARLNYLGAASIYEAVDSSPATNSLVYAGGTCSLCAAVISMCNSCPITITSGATCMDVYNLVDPNIPSTVEAMITLLEETLKKTEAGIVHQNS